MSYQQSLLPNQKNVQACLSPIWIVEDDVAIREVLQLSFQTQGIEIAWATNGEEAKQLLEQSLGNQMAPSLVILDGRLPDTHGLELAKLFRPFLPEATEIYLFSADSVVNAETLQERGITDLLRKPFDTDRLFEIANAHWLRWTQKKATERASA